MPGCLEETEASSAWVKGQCEDTALPREDQGMGRVGLPGFLRNFAKQSSNNKDLVFDAMPLLITFQSAIIDHLMKPRLSAPANSHGLILFFYLAAFMRQPHWISI